jgi:hypothetical protein
LPHCKPLTLVDHNLVPLGEGWWIALHLCTVYRVSAPKCLVADMQGCTSVIITWSYSSLALAGGLGSCIMYMFRLRTRTWKCFEVFQESLCTCPRLLDESLYASSGLLWSSFRSSTITSPRSNRECTH